MMKVLFIGSGATRAICGEKAPLARDFGKVFNSTLGTNTNYQSLISALEYLEKDKKDWELEDVWHSIDANHKFRQIVDNSEIDWLNAGWQLKLAVNEIYGTELQGTINTLGDNELEKLGRYLRQLEKNDCLVTTNYDLLIESICEKRLQWNSPINCMNNKEMQDRKDHIYPPLLKLHGSLDWVHETDSTFMTHQIKRNKHHEPVSYNYLVDKSDDKHKRPCIIGTVHFKDEMIFQSNQPGVRWTPLSRPIL